MNWFKSNVKTRAETESISEIEDKEKCKKLDNKEIINIIIDEYIISNPNLTAEFEEGKITKKAYFNKIIEFMDIRFEGEKIDEQIIKEELDSYLFGYWILQPLIDDENISDIKAISFNNIRIKEKGNRKNSEIKFESMDDFIRYVKFVAIKNNISLSESTAIQRIVDSKTSDKFRLRINMASEYVNSNEIPYLYIRKIPKQKKSLKELEELNMFNDDIYKYLIESMQNGLTIGIVGQGASGKTTLMNALIDELPKNKSGLIIQEAEELFTDKHPEMICQRVVENSNDCGVNYNLKTLAINGLLIDIDFFCIGEIKGAEASDMANAIYTGAQGLFSSHANGTREGINKLIHYMKYESDLKRNELLEMLTSVDIMIYMKKFKIIDITEIDGFDFNNNTLKYVDIFKYNLDGSYIKNERCKKVKDKLDLNKSFSTNNKREVLCNI